MNQFVVIAATVAGLVTAPATLIDLVFGQSRRKTALATVANFAVVWTVAFLYYLLTAPPLVGPWSGYAGELTFGLIVTTIIFGCITFDGVGEKISQTVRRSSRDDYESPDTLTGQPDDHDNPEPGGPKRRNFRWLGSLLRSTPGHAKNVFHDVPGAWLAGALAIALILTNLGMIIFTPWNNQEAKALARILSVETVTDGSLPPTSPEQLPVVPEVAARSKAQSQYGSYLIPAGFHDAGRPLSTRFSVGDEGNITYYDDHLYYAFELLFAGAANNHKMGQVSPCYILADAVDQRQPIQLKCGANNQGYRIRYMSVNYGLHQLDRYIWSQGYSHYILDDIRLEPSDNGDPYYVGSLSKRAVRFSGQTPELAIWVNAQTGEIHTSALDQAPAWSERIISPEAIKYAVNNWGNYTFENRALIPWHRNKGVRYKVAGEPEFVYTDSGKIQWQVLLQSRSSGSDTSVNQVMMLDNHTLKAKLYPAKNVATEEYARSTVNHVIGDSKESADAYLVMMYNRLTWVVPVVTKGDEKGQSVAGLAYVAADSVNPANVRFDPSVVTATMAYRRWINQAISINKASNDNKIAEGEVTRVTSNLVLNGQSLILVELDTYPGLTFRISIDTQGMTVETAKIAVGQRAKFGYVDVDRQIQDVTTADVLGVNETEPVGS